MSLFNKTGLVAWYPMTEGSGTTLNDYQGTNNGTLTNGPTWQKEKDGGYSLKFNGSNQTVNIGSGLSTGLTKITISIWFNPVVVTGGNYRGIISELYAGDGNVQFTLCLNNTGLLFGGFYDGTWRQVSDTSSAIITNTWTHGVGTYDGNYIRIYKNGVLVATSTDQSRNLPIGTNGWMIARRHDTYEAPNNHFNGKIGETIIWNRALTSNEIKALYEKTYIE